MRYLFLLLGFWGLMTSCEREVEPPAEVDFSYFPLENGTYVEYQVDSILYNDFNYTIDSSSYFLLEEIGEVETGGEGKEYHRVYRSLRQDTTRPWSQPRIWSAYIDNYRAIRQEENLRFIRLVFPVRQDKAWDGLVYVRRDTVIPFDEETYETIAMFKNWEKFVYLEVDAPATVNGLFFPETTLVLHVDDVNEIERRYSLERYAKNVGLIYKEMWILDTQCRGKLIDCIGVPWDAKAEKGFILRQSVRRYGK